MAAGPQTPPLLFQSVLQRAQWKVAQSLVVLVDLVAPNEGEALTSSVSVAHVSSCSLWCHYPGCGRVWHHTRATQCVTSTLNVWSCLLCIKDSLLTHSDACFQWQKEHNTRPSLVVTAGWEENKKRRRTEMHQNKVNESFDKLVRHILLIKK